LLPGHDIYSKKINSYSDGNAIAAAFLVPALARTAAALTNYSSFYEFADILQNGSRLRGEVGLKNKYYNKGSLFLPLLTRLTANRIYQKNNILSFSHLKKVAYIHIDTLLFGKFANDIGAVTSLIPFAGSRQGTFTRTYQYYDRAFTFSGIRAADALYNLNTPMHLTAIEKKELAVVAYRGCIFLLCTRNRHRGWILNLESIIPAGGVKNSRYMQFDSNDGLLFVMSGHGEILVIDSKTGLLQKLVINSGGIVTSEKALATDHGQANCYFAVDGKYNNLWIYGSGSRYMTLLGYRRSGSTVYLNYNRHKECNKTPLNLGPVSSAAAISKIFSPPVLFKTGSLNFIVYPSGKRKAAYIISDRHGNLLKTK